MIDREIEQYVQLMIQQNNKHYELKNREYEMKFKNLQQQIKLLEKNMNTFIKKFK